MRAIVEPKGRLFVTVLSGGRRVNDFFINLLAGPGEGVRHARDGTTLLSTMTESKASPLGLVNERRLSNGIVVGGAPSPTTFANAQAQDFTTVVSLRSQEEPGAMEEKAAAEAAGLQHAFLPIGGPADLSQEMAQALDDLLKEAGEGHTIVHCASGNRVGALLALRAHYCQKLPAGEAVRSGVEAGMTGLTAWVEQQLAE